MSCIARFFVVADERLPFFDALLRQPPKKMSLISRLLSEPSMGPYDYLSTASEKSLAFPLSGFVISTYLYELLEPQQELQALLKSCSVDNDEQFLVFSTGDAHKLYNFLK